MQDLLQKWKASSWDFRSLTFLTYSWNARQFQADQFDALNTLSCKDKIILVHSLVYFRIQNRLDFFEHSYMSEGFELLSSAWFFGKFMKIHWEEMFPYKEAWCVSHPSKLGYHSLCLDYSCKPRQMRVFIPRCISHTELAFKMNFFLTGLIYNFCRMYFWIGVFVAKCNVQWTFRSIFCTWCPQRGLCWLMYAVTPYQ